MSGTLYVVATPIGNLDDLTPRARQTLANVSLIAAEDTRHTGRLLMHIACKTRLMTLHDHNEEKVVGDLIATLKDGDSIALVSDAGTPLISDPGFRLVREAHRNNIPVSPIVGASAGIAALSSSGIATDRFCFEGFLPSKETARRDALGKLANETRTLVFYESVHRIADCLADMVAVFGADRQAFIGRELTKMHEQCVQETLATIKQQIDDGAIVSKGEFVVIVSGNDAIPDSDIDNDQLLLELAAYLPAKDVAKVAARILGKKKNALYERLLQLKAANT
jgi:16S rRNA (cytidine1402-2'-O)-methyltransferase